MPSLASRRLTAGPQSGRAWTGESRLSAGTGVILGSVLAPTGRQLRIAQGGQRAVVVEVGAGIREYAWGGRPVLDGYGEREMASGRRGLPLLPWPNRIADGRYRFQGADLQLPITQVAEHNAIHGLTSFQAWMPVEESPHRVRLATTVHPQPGYPFTLELEVGYELAEDGLTVTTGAHNPGDRPLPFGAGHHPYLAPASRLVDAVQLTLPAATVLEADGRGIPTGRRPVAGDLDFRRGRRIGELHLDHCFTDLEPSADGAVRVTVGDLELWMDPGYPYLMVYTGDTLAEPRRRRGLAVEPMTCPPNAFQSGEALLVLEPGARWRGRWGLKLRTP